MLLTGKSKTYHDRLASSTTVSGRSDAYHHFLNVTQPIPEDAFPADKLLRAGQTYHFDFLFVVPEQLLSRACRHVAPDHVHNAHLKLPPSLGDRAVSGRGDELLDDFAPDMACITYTLTASLVEADRDDCCTTQSRTIRILPVVEEQPPITIDHPQTDYNSRCEKNVKAGLLKGRLGRLVMEMSQPKSINLPSPHSGDYDAPSTMATVNLRFDPTEATSSPPRLGTLSGKFKVTTFYATTARTSIPQRKDIQWDLHQGFHSHSIALPSRCVAGVEWTHHEHQSYESMSRHNSTSSSSSDSRSSIPAPSSKYRGQGFYTATILVPITLPTNKSFVPSFHSCIISRIYSLDMRLGLHSVTLMAPSLDLEVPIQVSVAPSPEAQRRASLVEQQEAMDEMDADDLFLPHATSFMGDHLVGHGGVGSNLSYGREDSPPQYEAIPQRGVSRGVRVLG